MSRTGESLTRDARGAREWGSHRVRARPGAATSAPGAVRHEGCGLGAASLPAVIELARSALTWPYTWPYMKSRSSTVLRPSFLALSMACSHSLRILSESTSSTADEVFISPFALM